ncbi:hypothetical protein H7J86_33015 [Mycobacterium hackensackense]|uniref:hypothetical protein n=1 Tax=Mycobacterium hackensackense TaxID=228909 RepID=UPI002265B629|nr:hypothetical protein [Mycobacterium hackensackense]MCV7257008.1 hypothetical protein [Mycobacterium hackensackense]
MELSVRPFFKTGIAVTMAGAIALSPVIATGQHPLGVPVHLPQVSVSEVHLAAAISPRDVAALTANLNAALEGAGSTVTALVDNASHTLTSVLSTAAGLNTSLWDQLIAASAGSPTLNAVLVALKAASGGALLQLTNTVGAAGDDIALTTGQVAELLTSTVTGTVGTVAQAVASVVNNPLAASSYIGLLNTPFGVAGLALQAGITGLSQLGTTGLHLANGLVQGVTAQVSNALDAVNNLLDVGKTVTDIALINGTLTAIQGIVSAPVSAIVAGVNGIASAVTNAGVSALEHLAGGANAIVGTWLGSGSTPGAVIKAVSAIGQEPLSLGSYTKAVSILVGAAGSTVGSVVNTATAFASMPFRFAADLTGPGAQVVNSLVSGVATAASGLLRAAGLSPLIAGLPNNLATVVTGAVTVAALATKTTLNAIATAIDVGHAIGGWVTSSKSSAATVTLSTTKADIAAARGASADDSGARNVTHPLVAPAKTQPADSAATPTSESVTTADVDAVASSTTPKTDSGTSSQASGTEQQTAAPRTDAPSATTPSEKTDLAGATAKKSEEPAAVKPKRGASSAAAPAEGKTTETYGRHAASPARSATATAPAAGSSSGADTSSAESGGRHRRDEGASHKTASDSDASSASQGAAGGGRHAAGKHAAAA